jgi:transcriptional regulator with XRE-family HTH domain
MTKFEADTFREMLKRYRQNLRISQQDLATRARISQSALSNFECGRFGFRPSTATRVQRALFEVIGDRAASVGFLPMLPAVGNAGPADASPVYDLQVRA